MQLGDIIRDLSEETRAGEALHACGDLTLLARLDEMAGRFDETIGEYAAGSVRRFANLASSEDWLALMNAIERAVDPGLVCLTQMLSWSLKWDETKPAAQHPGCTCGGSGGCT